MEPEIKMDMEFNLFTQQKAIKSHYNRHSR